jgi:hypothetical protein
VRAAARTPFYSRDAHGVVEGFEAKRHRRIYCWHQQLSSAGVRGNGGSGSAGALACHTACAAPPAEVPAWGVGGRLKIAPGVHSRSGRALVRWLRVAPTRALTSRARSTIVQPQVAMFD